MKILVVTPTLGESRWLADTVASVAALPLAYEHVLVAPEVAVPALTARFSGVTVVAETKGGGMYAAVNTGLEAARDWDAFTYINDDDLLLPHFVTVAAALERSAGRPLIVYGRVRLIDGAGRRLGAIPVSPMPRLNRDLYAQRIEPVFQHGTLVSRATWKQQGGFDPAFRFCGDSEYLARLCIHGVSALRVSGEVAAFRLRHGQLTKNRLVMVEERKRVDQKLNLPAESKKIRHHWARLIFRTANLPVYAERILRHGFVSFDELLERGE